MRCLWLVWSLLAWLAAILCTIGCLLPYWVKGYVYLVTPSAHQTERMHMDRTLVATTPHAWKLDGNRLLQLRGLRLAATHTTDLGLFRRCGYPMYINRTVVDVDLATTFINPPVIWEPGCGHYSHLARAPHLAWRIAFFMLIAACLLLFFTTFFLFMLGFVLRLLSSKLVYRSCQFMLLMAGSLTLLSCVLYAVGWTDNTEIRQACGETAYTFNLGRCHVGWAYVLTCSGGLLSLFAAAIPMFTSIRSKSPIETNDPMEQKQQSNNQNGTLCYRGREQHVEPYGDDHHDGRPSLNTANGNTSHRPESMYLLPHHHHHLLNPNGSPAGSSSPSVSLLRQDKTMSTVMGTDASAWPLRNSLMSGSGSVRSTSINHPYMYTSYMPQRYSTGALLGHSLSGHHALVNPRVSVTMPADPLIYVAEEEEHDTLSGFETTVHESQGGEVAVGSTPVANVSLHPLSTTQIPPSVDGSQLHVCIPQMDETHMHDVPSAVWVTADTGAQLATTTTTNGATFTADNVSQDLSSYSPCFNADQQTCQGVMLSGTVQRKRTSCVL